MGKTNKHQTRILVTDVGHIVTPSTLDSLRRVEGEDYYIVGVDVRPNALGFAWTDTNYTVPPAHDSSYVKRLVEVCQAEKVDVLVPWTDDEIEVVAEKISTFRTLGIAVLCSTRDSVRKTIDKGILLQELACTDIPTPDFLLASTPDEIEEAAINLGYPDKPVVVKPRRSSGGRGLWILDREVNLLQRYPGQRFPLAALLSVLSQAVDDGQQTTEYVVMQYLAGDNYSVDLLAEHGEPVFVIPRRRKKAVQGASQTGEICANPEVRSMVVRIVQFFGLHLNVNVQLAYSEGSKGHPLIYEINPRISGTIVANAAAGLNLLHYGIQLALGKQVPSRDSMRVREGSMVRYWSEHYEFNGKDFKP